MEAIAQIQGNEIPDILNATVGAFLPLLLPKKASIDAVAKKTLSFGPSDRQKLDVYYPPGAPSKSPVIIWVYGGGLTSGSRTLDPPVDIAYANVGAFFAGKGFVTVVPDYRLVPAAKFPEPVQDVADAISFVVSGQQIPEADNTRVFIIGDSAGGTHVSTAFLTQPPHIGATTLPSIKGIILLSAALHFETSVPSIAPPDLEAYYGKDNIGSGSPQGLLKAAGEDAIKILPPIKLIVAEREMVGIQACNEDFAQLLAQKTGKDVPLIVAKGHNHVSAFLALSSGQGEAWAEEVAEWASGI